MQYGYERVALCTRGSCRHGPSRHKGIMSKDGDYQGAQEVGECRDCHCVGYDPEWAERNPEQDEAPDLIEETLERLKNDLAYAAPEIQWMHIERRFREFAEALDYE